MEHIEHLGIAVHDLDISVGIYEKLLGTPCYKREVVESELVETAFFRTGNNKVELLQPTSPNSVLHRFLDKHGEGIHHVAYHVEDIDAEMKRLKAEGFRLLSETAKRGADNKLICFVHPKDASGVLVELCQDISAKEV